MNTHTPGPWEVVELKSAHGGWSGWNVWADAICDEDGTLCHDVFCEADARLIAAAPALLAACQRVLANSEHGSWCPAITSSAPCACYYEVARQAVCKALGESL